MQRIAGLATRGDCLARGFDGYAWRLAAHDGFGFSVLPALSPAEDGEIHPHGSRSHHHGGARKLTTAYGHPGLGIYGSSGEAVGEHPE
jgi:hypothetical protein